MDPPRVIVPETSKRPVRLHDTLKDVEEHAATSGNFREIKQSHRFLSYVALMRHIIDS